MKGEIIGWDVGGAHLKAAVLRPSGSLVRVIQYPCPLWKGLDVLQYAFKQALQQIPEAPQLHALTMTGELADLFCSREEGVCAIAKVAASMLGDDRLRIFAGKLGFIRHGQLSAAMIDAIASANWFASAAQVARQASSALLLDIGSTTTDIVPIAAAAVQAEATTDFERLAAEELVYTGIVRTPVMAITRAALFKGRHIPLMAEYFATMADVYRLTGELDAAHDQTPSADGAPKTVHDSARRLARMIGRDFSPAELALWRDFALGLRSRQIKTIQNACERQLSRFAVKPEVFVGAGIGRFLVRELAGRLGYAYRDFGDFFPRLPADSPMTCADCAPAVAVAALAVQSVM